MNAGNPYAMRVSSGENPAEWCARSRRLRAQKKTAPGALCANSEPKSQGLADWIGVD